jgi:hypothetical protein
MWITIREEIMEIREILGVVSIYQAALMLHLSRRNVQNAAQIPRLISLLENRLLLNQSMTPTLPVNPPESLTTLEDTSMAVTRPRVYHHRQNRKDLLNFHVEYVAVSAMLLKWAFLGLGRRPASIKWFSAAVAIQNLLRQCICFEGFASSSHYYIGKKLLPSLVH